MEYNRLTDECLNNKISSEIDRLSKATSEAKIFIDFN